MIIKPLIHGGNDVSDRRCGGSSQHSVVFVAKACFESGIELWVYNANHTCSCVGSLFSQDLSEPYFPKSEDTDFSLHLWPGIFSNGKYRSEPAHVLKLPSSVCLLCVSTMLLFPSLGCLWIYQMGHEECLVTPGQYSLLTSYH